MTTVDVLALLGLSLIVTGVGLYWWLVLKGIR